MMPGSTGLQCVHHCRPLCRVDGSPGLYPTTMMQIISCAKVLGEQITLKKEVKVNHNLLFIFQPNYND